MKISASTSTLLVIDIQERLLPKIDQAELVLRRAIWCVDLALAMDVPIVLTEHFPEKIGTTPAVLREKIKQDQILSKTYFSAMAEGELPAKLGARKQVIVVGTEAHVCVLQTVIDLIDNGYQVYLVSDGLGSRKNSDKELAMNRLQQLGAQIISCEMLAFEWLQKAGSTKFREILERFLK